MYGIKTIPAIPGPDIVDQTISVTVSVTAKSRH